MITTLASEIIINYYSFVKSKIMEEVKQRGRKKMTDEEKAKAKAEKEAKKAAIQNGEIEISIFDKVKALNKEVKKAVVKLSAKEIDKLKGLLTENFDAVDVALAEKIEKERNESIQRIDSELTNLEKMISDLKNQKSKLLS